MTVIYDKVAVIGMGLIGASIALAARRGGLATTIIGSDQSPEVAAVVARLQLVDSFEANAVHGSDAPETAREEISFFFEDSDICPRAD